jgi:AraC family transcriptional regulator of adaptative response/methylated-DNA-[protein]-cysteine methyltransferase
LAKRENVRFHANCEEAERAGFRPCKRCRPNEESLKERQQDAVTRVCRLIEASDVAPSLCDLAKHVSMSPFRLHRLFKAITGVTPKAYAAAHRNYRICNELAKRTTITEAIHSVGFNSSSRFYESSTRKLGMTPSAYRAGGDGAAIRFAVGECSLGSVLIAASDKGICAILLGDDPDTLARDLQNRFPKANLLGGDLAFDRWVAEVIGLVEKPALGHDLPLDIRGTAFQLRVWKALQSIPPGNTASYAEIAARIGQPNAARAVARASAANPIAVAIPCHRVVRTDETISGYRWGVERKVELLRRERSTA